MGEFYCMYVMYTVVNLERELDERLRGLRPELDWIDRCLTLNKYVLLRY